MRTSLSSASSACTSAVCARCARRSKYMVGGTAVAIRSPRLRAHGAVTARVRPARAWRLVLIDDVVQFDVTMHHAVVVAVEHGREELLDESRRGTLAVAVPMVLHAADQRAACGSEGAGLGLGLGLG